MIMQRPIQLYLPINVTGSLIRYILYIIKVPPLFFWLSPNNFLTSTHFYYITSTFLSCIVMK